MLLIAACSSRHGSGDGKGKTIGDTISHLKDTNKNIKWPDTPDFDKHLAPLLAFVERSKGLPAFDTLIGFDDQGFGPVDNYYNFVKAGNLFSNIQRHMLLFYDFADRDYRPLARMAVFVEDKKQLWRKVLDDTLEVSDMRFYYRDWNGDGIRDFAYMENGWLHGGHGPITWYLWLVHKDGTLARVKDFDDLDDPKIDSLTGHIFSNHIVNHQGVEMGEYVFKGDRIIKLHNIYSALDTPEVARYYKNDRLIKTVKFKKGSRGVYLPKHEEEDE